MKIFLVPAVALIALAAPMTAAYADDPDSPEFWAILEGKPYAGAPDPATVSTPVVYKAAHRTFLAKREHHARRPAKDVLHTAE